MLPDTAASKVTAAHLSRTALLYVRQSSLKQVIHNTESAIRQYDLRGKAIALGWAAGQITVIDIDQGHSGASAADREGFQQLVAEVSLGRAGIVLGLECSRLARNSADWHQLLELCGMTGTLICDEDGLYDPRNFNDRLLLGLKGTIPKASCISSGPAARRAAVQGPPRRADHAAARRASLRRRRARHPRPRHRRPRRPRAPVRHVRGDRVGDRVREGVPRRRAVFPWRHLKGPRKGEIDWKPLRHHAVLRVLHNPRYAGAFTYGRHADTTPGGKLPPPRCPARSGSPSSPAPTPDTSPWNNTTPTSPG